MGRPKMPKVQPVQQVANPVQAPQAAQTAVMAAPPGTQGNDPVARWQGFGSRPTWMTRAQRARQASRAAQGNQPQSVGAVAARLAASTVLGA